MKTLIYEGGGGPKRSYARGRATVTFEVGQSYTIEDDAFADELLSQNPDGLTVEQAEPYGIPVFREVSGRGPAAITGKGGEEVGG